MFRSLKQKSEKSGERFDFKFSSFQALQVPKEWNKLFLSIISVDTGKAIRKSGKASVRNGNCRWTDSFTESIWIPQGDTSKEIDEFLVKLIVAMGSSRSGILGEATVNLASYITSKGTVPLSLPLKKCSHGTILQVKIQCLTPRAKLRDEQLKDTDLYLEDGNLDDNDLESRSDVSDGIFTRSVGSSSSNHLEAAIHPGELCSGDTSFSASGSRYSFDSLEGSFGRDNYSPHGGVISNMVGKQDSTGSQSSSSCGSHSFNDFARSNNTPFNSKMLGAGGHAQNHREDLNRVSRAVPLSPLRNAGSSKDLLEAAEIKIEELQAEARMWEQNARKLMVDSEKLQRELFDQSKCQASVEMELSRSQIECDSLKQEIEQLKILLEEASVKQTDIESLKFQAKDVDGVQKELEQEIKFQREENANLALQLKKTQDSNIELVSILQELEETIEKQNVEINSISRMRVESKEPAMDENGYEDSNRNHSGHKNLELQLQQLQESEKTLESTIQFLEKSLEDKRCETEIEQGIKNQSLIDCEAEWRSRLADKEEKIITLEARLSEALNAQGLKEAGFQNEGNHNLIKEIDSLKLKVQELEKDCNELTDENLELFFKLKESKKVLPGNISVCAPETEESKEETEPCNRQEELKKKNFVKLPSDDISQVQSLDSGNKCADLEHQLQSFKDRASYLDSELSKYRAKVEEQEIEITSLLQQLECYQGMKAERKDRPEVPYTGSNSESLATSEFLKLIAELDQEIQLSLAKLQQESTIYHPTNNGSNFGFNWEISKNMGSTNLKEQVEVILNNFIQFKLLFEAKAGVCHNELQCSEEAREDKDLRKELLEMISEIDKLKSNNLLKEEQLDSLRYSLRESENRISSLKNDRNKLEENIEVMHGQGAVTAKCLDDLRNEMMALNSSMESQISANKILGKKSSELESGKNELEVHLSELEKENVQLSERICGLEAQLRYLTDERESSRLELQNSESEAISLKVEIKRLETEMDANKVDMKQKLEEMQKRWLEAQEECEYLKVANPKLQATAESLIEECSLLQKVNGGLRKQKTDLHDRCTVLEAELKESEKLFSNMLSEVEALEEKYSTMLEEIASKEKAFNLELDALLHENRIHNEKLDMEASQLNQIYLEKTVEVDNLQREVAHLTEQISATQDEKDKTASEAVLAVSHLRADKAMLEAAVQDVQGKLKLSESNLISLQMQSQMEVQLLKDEIAATKQKEEVLTSDHEKLLNLLEDVKSNEEKLKITVRGLELKLKASEYESVQLTEEISSLKVQLQKTVLLQDEILALKRTLSETKFEKERLEASFQMLSRDHEELQAERNLVVQKISSSQKAVSELEDCRRRKVALEEKVLRLEGDLTAREALGAQEAALKNELAQMRRENSQLQRKIKCLEEEKEECLNRAQALEEELKQIKEEKQDPRASMDGCLSLDTNSKVTSTSINDNLNFSPVELEENHNLQAGEKLVEFVQLQHHSDENQRQVDNKQNFKTEASQVIGFDLLSKIRLLENELAEALDANDMYKGQLKSLLSERVSGHSDDADEKLGVKKVERKDGYESNNKTSALETELRDLRERYFHMSLKYAEVEAQREQLVIKLKAATGKRSWFS